MLGYPDQALERSQEALTLAQELSHPSVWRMLCNLRCGSIGSAGRGRRPREQAEALVTLSTEHGFAQWVAGGTIMQGWALAVQGQEGGGNGPDAPWPGGLAGHGDRGVLPYWLALLAEAYGSTGQIEAGAAACWPRRWTL